MMQNIIQFIQTIWKEIYTSFYNWNALDFILLLFASIALILGAIRGLKSQIFVLIGYVGAFIVAAHFYTDLIPWVRKRIFSTVQSKYPYEVVTDGGTGSLPIYTIHASIAFVLLFFFVWSAFWFTRLICKKFTVTRPIGIVNRLIGAAFGIIHFTFLWGVLYILLWIWPLGSIHHWVTSSVWMNHMQQWLPYMMIEAIKWVNG